MTRIGLGAAVSLAVSPQVAYDLELDFWIGEGQAVVTLSPGRDQQPFTLKALVRGLAEMLGLSDELGPLADITQREPWSALFDVEIAPYLTVEAASTPSVELAIKLFEHGRPGVSFPPGGLPTWLTFEPSFTVYELLVTYDRSKTGLDLRAKVAFGNQQSANPQLRAGEEPPAKTEVVSYPFPVPSSGSPNFEVIYLGLGQRFGPTVDMQAADPLQQMFTDLEATFRTNNPEELLGSLVRDYYDPARGWFVAADVAVRGWRVMAVFNDPVLYGLRITSDVGQFKGLLFEILYQKLGPGLGVFYGALSLPETFRHIQLGAAAITLPSFRIWLYTNGDFKVEVGWPLGDNSIGIEIYIFTGGCGFYFGKLRSADHPDSGGRALNAHALAAGLEPVATETYNPILVFGLGLWLGVGRSIHSGPFSASLSLTVRGTFEGIIAWKEDGTSGLSRSPDYHWFAATVGVVGQLQGEVDLKVVKLSVLVRLSLTAGVAFESGYGTVLNVAARVDVSASLKILFVTISVRFHTTITADFTLSSPAPGNGNASLDGPRNPAFHGMNDWAITGLVRPTPPRALATGPAPQLPLPAALTTPVTVLLGFLLQPTAVYDTGTGTSTAVATLTIEAPSPTAAPGSEPTDLDRLFQALARWLLREWSGGRGHWAGVVTALGEGGPPPPGWEASLDTFLTTEVAFVLHGIDLTSAGADDLTLCAFPMFEELQLARTGADEPVVFSRTGTTHPNYVHVIDDYFAQLSVNSSMSNPAPRGSSRYGARASDADDGRGGPPNGPTLMRLIFDDYFLTAARQLAGELPGTGQELPDHAQVANTGGLVSRYLLHALRLPDPASTPSASPIDLYDLDVRCGHDLTGQQFPLDATQATCRATLSLSPDPDGGHRIRSIHFADDKDEVSASLPVSAAPPPPAPVWSGPDPAVTAGEATIRLATLPPAQPHDLWVTQRSRLPWQLADQVPAFLVPLPEGILTLMNGGPLDLNVRTSPPGIPSQQGAYELGADAVPALLIDLRLTLVGRSVPFVYAVSGIDDRTRERIESLLLAPEALDDAELSLLYAAPTTGYRSDALDPARHPVGVCKTNLSTSTEPHSPDLYGRGPLAEEDPTSWASVTDPAGFLRLLWEESVVHTPGFFLRYTNAEGKDLPRSLFDENGRPGPIDGVPSGTTAPLTVLITFPPATPFRMYHNAFRAALPEGYDGTLYLGPHRSGRPLQVLQPAYPPGCMGFEATWTMADMLRRSSGSLYDSTWVAALYQLIQFRLTGGEPSTPGAATGAQTVTFRPSLWSLALSASTESSGDHAAALESGRRESYRQILPVAAFVDGPGTGPYAAVGGVPEVEFRLNDVFGNDLGEETYRARFPVWYNDPLLTPNQWPGVRIAYRFVPSNVADRRAAAISLRLDFDPHAVIPPALADMPVPVHMPTPAAVPVELGAAVEDKARQQAEAALARYTVVLAQLADPNTAARVTTSVFTADDGVVGDGAAIRRELAAFAADVAAQLEKVIAHDGEPQPVRRRVSIGLDPADLRRRDGDIFPVTVALTLTRPNHLVFAEPDGATVPGCAVATVDIAADLDERRSATTAVGSLPVGIELFARDFQAAFADFDGEGGTARVAVRTGQDASDEAETDPSVWAIRWSTSHGIHAAFPAAGAGYFALPPLSTELMAGTASVPNYSAELRATWSERTFAGIDLDSWASVFLDDLDEVLSAETAVAIASLDADAYADVLKAKAVLARALALGLEPVYQDTPQARTAGIIPGDLAVARDRFEQAMLRTLGAARSVSSVVQVPAAITMIPSAGGRPAARLYGALTAQTPATDAHGATVSPAKLSLVPTTDERPQYLTFTVSATERAETATVPLDLSYHARFVELIPGQERTESTEQGYIASEWLRIALDEPDDPLTMPLAKVAAPVPSRTYPPVPRLEAQTARQSQSPTLTASPIDPYLRWDYETELTLPQVVAQDELWVMVEYNRPLEVQASGGDPLQGLFEALASFTTARPTLLPLLPRLSQAADGQPSAGPAPSAIIAALLDQVKLVTRAWARLRGLPDPFPDDEPHPSTSTPTAAPHTLAERYVLDFSDAWAHHTLHVRARAGTGADAADVIWPTINDHQPLTPSNMAGQDSAPLHSSSGVHGWHRADYDFTPAPGEHDQALRLTWGTLDLLSRQSAAASAWRVRNARLANDREVMTNPAFVYQTPTVTFHNPIVPLITVPATGPVPSGRHLAETLARVLAPLAVSGAAATTQRLIDVHLAYSFALTSSADGGSVVRSHTDVLLANDVTLLPSASSDSAQSPQLDAGGVTLEQLAGQLAEDADVWHAYYQPRTDQAVLTVSATLFAQTPDARLPILRVSGVDITVPANWWQP